MGNLKTSLEEKNRVINEVIKCFEVKRENEKNNRIPKAYWSERIGLINREKDTDKKYKKACNFNRTFNLGVEVRKTDRFGESKNKEVKKELVKVELEEANEEFIKANLDAENSVKVASKTSDFETAIAPIDETSNVDIVLIKEAISRGVKVFYSSFFSDNKDIRKVGYKNNVVDIYYIKNVGLIEVDNNK